MKMKQIFFILFIFQCFFLFATAQFPDVLIYNGKKYALTVNPMEIFFEKFPEKRPEMPHTGLWRGYIATFEIIDNELWVIDIVKCESVFDNGNFVFKYISIINDCLDGKNRMKIDWFNGLLVLPQGDILNYVHMGYASTYEYYTIMEIQEGNYIKELNMDYTKYIEFKENQFEHYKKTESYKKLFERLNDGNMVEDEIENFLRIFIIEYSEKIYE